MEFYICSVCSSFYLWSRKTCNVNRWTKMDWVVLNRTHLPGRRTLRSDGTSHLMVPSIRRSTVGDRAFTVAGPRVWNTLPEEITTSQTLSTFRQQLKTWLFRKSYPDIIVGTSSLYTLYNNNLEVALLLRQPLIDWLIDCIQEKFQDSLLSCDLQFGFKQKSSCSHAIFLLKQVTDYFTARGSNVYLAALEFRRS